MKRQTKIRTVNFYCSMKVTLPVDVHTCQFCNHISLEYDMVSQELQMRY